MTHPGLLDGPIDLDQELDQLQVHRTAAVTTSPGGRAAHR